jgi:succinyl-CoA:acetate CoA-transferase
VHGSPKRTGHFGCGIDRVTGIASSFVRLQRYATTNTADRDFCPSLPPPLLRLNERVSDRIRDPRARAKVMSAADAAALIPSGAHIGMSGFTSAGYPKLIPQELARRIATARTTGHDFGVEIWTGASTAPELDAVLAESGGVDMRMPYQSDPVIRAKINAGLIDYLDIHLSHVAQMVWEGFFGRLDVAVIEVSGITQDGELIPSTSIGNNKTWIDLADRVILEVNSEQPSGLDGIHDIYYGTALPPNRRPVQITSVGDRIGQPYFRCPPDKIVAVVETALPDRPSDFKATDANSELIAAHVLDFYRHEITAGRLPKNLLPIQSGVGNIANAVLAGLSASEFSGLAAYTEVIQDGMLDLLLDGTLAIASSTAFSFSEEGWQQMRDELDVLRERVVLRPEEISNHPEVVRRLGVLAMNGLIEADIYGNVNSTHVMGSAIQNGIGGSGDFARNAYISTFMTPSTAKHGAISCIVPMVSHVDHTEHDVHVIVTEQGLADLRGVAPTKRAQRVIDNCAHPDYRDALQDYFDRASHVGARHTPHLLDEALSWHSRFLRTGTMKH